MNRKLVQLLEINDYLFSYFCFFIFFGGGGPVEVGCWQASFCTVYIRFFWKLSAGHKNEELSILETIFYYHINVYFIDAVQ